MSAPNPHRPLKEMTALGWTPEQLANLTRHRARALIDMAWDLAMIHPAWAPLRGEAPEDRGLALGISDAALTSYLALPADPGDDDDDLVASVTANDDEQPSKALDPETKVLSREEATVALDRQIAEFRARRWGRGGRR